jgi:acyl carrier protein
MLDALEKELCTMIMESCRVTDAPSVELSPDAPLFGPESAFGLDSLDAVEVVVAVQRNYHVRIDAQETSREVLQSLRTLAQFIRSRQEPATDAAPAAGAAPSGVRAPDLA